MIKKVIIVASLLILFSFLTLKIGSLINAEQSGSSPESGVTSRIKTISNDLISKGFGSTSSGTWGDWGPIWNRIYSSSIWVPGDATATVSDVASGKTFYAGNNRVKQTGAGSTQPTPSPVTPATGDASRLNTLYKALKTVSYGDELTNHSWGNWGIMWNRIYSAAVWTPNDATATVGDVVNGKTFYAGNNRTLQTGIYTIPFVDFVGQSLCQYDNSGSPCTPLLSTAIPETTWTNTATNVWKDDRTGLYWTEKKSAATNSFTYGCGFFTNPRGSWNGIGCGNVVNACASLSQVAVTGQSAKTDWYLPTYKELQQAYNDKMLSKTGSVFTGSAYFASSTESHLIANAGKDFTLNTRDNTFLLIVKGNFHDFRCVSRD